MEFSNQLGHFINALKQSLNTTKTTHIRHSHKPPEVQHSASTCTTRQDFPTPEEYCSTKGECSRPMRERPQGLRPTRLNGTRARSTYRLSAGRELNPSRRSIWRIAMGSAPFLRPLVAPGECPFSGAGESGQGRDATRLPVMTPTRALPLRHPGHSHLIGGLAPKEVVRIATHQCASEIVVLTAPATLFKTEKSSRSAGPQKRTKAPRCKLTRGARGCEPAPRTPHLLSHGTELSLAWPCPVGAAGCTHKSW
jgi:hypothetical protein